MKRFLVCLLGVGLVLSGSLVLSPIGLAADGEWSKKTDMPFPRLFFSVSAAGELVYVIGGMLAEPIARVDIYAPATDTWAQRADMPAARAGVVTAVVNGKIYAIGGWNNEAPALSTVEEYDRQPIDGRRKRTCPQHGCFSRPLLWIEKSTRLGALRQILDRYCQLLKNMTQRLTNGQEKRICQILDRGCPPWLWVEKSIYSAVCLTYKVPHLQPLRNTTPKLKLGHQERICQPKGVR